MDTDNDDNLSWAHDEVVSVLAEGSLGDGTTMKKFMERGEVITANDESIIFEVERHRGADSTYRKGSPMAAFTIYTARYILDRKSREIATQSETTTNLQYNAKGLADEHTGVGCFNLTIEKNGEDAYIVKETISNKSATATTCEEVVEFASAIVNDYPMEDLFVEIQDTVSEDEFASLITEIYDEMNKNAHRYAEKCWEDRDNVR